MSLQTSKSGRVRKVGSCYRREEWRASCGRLRKQGPAAAARRSVIVLLAGCLPRSGAQVASFTGVKRKLDVAHARQAAPSRTAPLLHPLPHLARAVQLPAGACLGSSLPAVCWPQPVPSSAALMVAVMPTGFPHASC